MSINVPNRMECSRIDIRRDVEKNLILNFEHNIKHYTLTFKNTSTQYSPEVPAREFVEYQKSAYLTSFLVNGYELISVLPLNTQNLSDWFDYALAQHDFIKSLSYDYLVKLHQNGIFDESLK